MPRGSQIRIFAITSAPHEPRAVTRWLYIRYMWRHNSSDVFCVTLLLLQMAWGIGISSGFSFFPARTTSSPLLRKEPVALEILFELCVLRIFTRTIQQSFRLIWKACWYCIPLPQTICENQVWSQIYPIVKPFITRYIDFYLRNPLCRADTYEHESCCNLTRIFA